MRRGLSLLVLGVIVLGMVAPALAAPEAAAPAGEPISAAAGQAAIGKGISLLGVSVGAAIGVIGGALGIGLIGSRAPDAIARQPEAAGSIFLAWLLPAAMIEGAALFGILISLLAWTKIS